MTSVTFNRLRADTKRQARKAYKTTYANLTAKDTLRYKAVMSHYADRSPGEIRSTRSMGRKSKALLSGLDGGTLNLWSPTDNADIVDAKRHIVTAYIKDKKGIEPMTDKNKQAMKWLVETTQGQRFPKPQLGGVKLEYTDKDGKKVEETVSLDAELAELDEAGEVEFKSDLDAGGIIDKESEGKKKAKKEKEARQAADDETDS
jgi:hypothetical protein